MSEGPRNLQATDQKVWVRIPKDALYYVLKYLIEISTKRSTNNEKVFIKFRALLVSLLRLDYFYRGI